MLLPCGHGILLWITVLFAGITSWIFVLSVKKIKLVIQDVLQILPTSSLHMIAQLIQFKHYNSGEYVVREGEIKDGIYFIWQGEVEVRGVSVSMEIEDRSEIQLKTHGYFGHGDNRNSNRHLIVSMIVKNIVILR